MGRTADCDTSQSAAVCTYTCDACRRRTHTCIPALPFCTATLKAGWRPAAYPNELKHLGDHIRRRRLDLGLLQKDVAGLLGTHSQTVCNWEIENTSPALRWLPGIIQFLGYDPRPAPEDVGQQLRHYRQGQGVSQTDLARELRVDPGTLARWEMGCRKPRGMRLRRVLQMLMGSN